jgi:4-hydroxybenzoyl-CoA thioesterase/acyl-CoA thioester hydrolase
LPREFSIFHRVQFRETDQAGIVHFANYFTMMEEVEHAFFRSIGLSVSMQHDGMHIGWPRVAASCDFTQPAKFEDEIQLKLRLARLGDKSLSYEIEFNLAGKPIALGKMTSVCCTLKDSKMCAIAIPQPLREKISAALQ